jgi:flagellar biogenesis protein FliO
MSSSRPVAWIALSALAAAAPAFAQQAAQTAESVSFIGELVSIVLPLAFIILVLVAVLHFARRRYGTTGQDAPLSVVQIVPLGPRERIVLLKTRTGRLFAVGVAAQSVNLITDLDPAELVPRTPADAERAGAAPGQSRPIRTSKVFGLPLIRRDLPRGARDADPGR